MGESGIRKQFEAVREAAGVPCFNPNGWRHTAITRMAEADIRSRPSWLEPVTVSRR
jgi:integrase